MKRDKIIYWIATGLISAMMLMSSFMYLSKSPEVLNGIKASGYPDYFIPFLGTAKLLAALALVIPVWSKLKEWAYAGIVFELTGAVVSNAVCRNRSDLIAPLSFLCLAIASWALRPPSRILGAPINADRH